MDANSQIIKDHYLGLYGKPLREASYMLAKKCEFEIFKWDASSTNEGISMYATCGVWQYKKNYELFIGIDPSVDSIIDAIAEAAIHGAGGNPPNSGDTITLPFSLWNGSRMKTFMFERDTDIIPKIPSSSYSVEFIQLVPLFEAELQYKIKYGRQRLWDTFEQNKVPYWSSERVVLDIFSDA